MSLDFFKCRRGWLTGAATGLALSLGGGFAWAEPQHGIAMYGAPALPADFDHLPYVNPDAPKGGTFTFGEIGSYDSLNPFILKGSAPYGWRVYGVESLMGRSWDEPFTLYGLLAETVDTGEDRSWVEFTLRPEARFSDGSPVTVEDVIWSFETLGTLGHPRYHGGWAAIETAEQTGERTVRFTLSEPNNEMPLILGLRPILKKATYADRAFDASGLVAPVGSGPYVIGDYEPGRYMELVKDPDWWGADLPFNRGQHNFETLRYEWFGDGDVAFEAFRAGELSTNRETNKAKLASSYDFSAMRSGDVVVSEIPHERPSGIAGFVMNTRRAPFDDWRVRQAMIEAYNFEYISRILNNSSDPRITSYYSNSVLAMGDGPAEGRVADYLSAYADDLPPGAMEGYALPVSDGSEANRRGTRAAMRSLQDAGWTVENGVMTSPEGEPLRFEILLSSGATQIGNIADIYASALRRIGAQVTVTSADSAQYTERTNAFDFDMAWYVRSLSLSPGNEQYLYWGAEAAAQDGSRNWMGVASPAVDGLIGDMLQADTQEDFRAATRALDRVLTAGRYVVPNWFTEDSVLVHRKELKYPDTIPMYGDWIGFQPDIWWWSED